MEQMIVDSVTSELSKRSNLPAEFNDQIARFREFKRRLDDAGIVYGDKYEIPLMSRIQSNSK